jgi:riboflavin kinase/FMN adenylyltransferase
LIQENRFAEIPSYLGRDFSIYGEVVHGEQRGQKLGFPTANIQPGITLALPNGVYVSKIKLADKTHFGVTNVGKRPTFGENTVTVETWLFDFKEDIYGKELEVIPLFQLRPEMKFSGMEDLQNQIKQDIENARKYLIEEELLPALT